MSVDQFLLSADTTDLNYPEIRPTLDLNFARVKALDPRITFTRSSGGSYVGADGLIKYAGVNEARFDHDPSSGESLGLLIEESRSNLLLRSEEFDNASWTPSVVAAAVMPNNAIAPNGTLTADLISGVSVEFDQRLQTVTLLNSTVYTYSIFIKQNTTLLTRFGVFNPPATWVGAVDVAWKSGIPSTLGTLGSPSNITYTPVGNGWYRCSLTVTSISTSHQIHFHPDRNNTQASAWAWGAQLEQGAFPTSYIPTQASTRTRAADNARIIGKNFSEWYRQDEGTLFTESKIFSYLTGNSSIASLWFNINNRMELFLVPVGMNIRPNIIVDGITALTTNITFGVTEYTNKNKIIFSFKQNNYFATINGGFRNVESYPTDFPKNIDRLLINRNFNHSMYLSRLTYFPKRLPNAQLQALTR
jgi:hypothetical protein